MKLLKVAIVGAGICGLYLAWKLSEKGYRVIVFEKRNKIGKESCSGLFSERILKFIPQSKELIENKIHSVLINFPKKRISVKFSKDFFVINHAKLDNLVADLAKSEGVDIILNQSINFIPREFDRVIGCDGAGSIIRKRLNLSDPKFRLGIQGFILKEDYSDFVEVWPTKYGFIWKIPRGKEREYGIIEKNGRAKQIFDKFLKEKSIKVERKASAIIPQGLIIPSNSKITLCGDAVGLTKPWSGGGVIWSLTASSILLKNFPDFLKYHKEIKKKFLPEIILSDILTKIFHFLGFNLPWFLPKNTRLEGDFILS